MKQPLAFVAAALLSLSYLHATSIPIVFDNISGIDNSQVWIQFLGGTNVQGTYNSGSSLNQPLASNTPYSLAQLTSSTPLVSFLNAQDQGLPAISVQNVSSGRLYINFGLEGLQGLGTPGSSYTPTSSSSSDPNYLTRYQYFEATITNGTFSGDLSYIDFTAISFSMKGINAPNGSNLDQKSVPGQTLVSATASVAKTPNLSVIPGAAFVLPSPEFARVISPQYAIAVGTNPTPVAVYQDMLPYLASLNGTTTQVAGLYVGTGNQPSADETTQQQTYNFTAAFSGTDENGSVTFTSVTTAGVSSGNANVPGVVTTPGTGVGDQATITITYKELNKVTGIYGNSPKYTVITTTGGGSYTTAGLVNDVFGRAVGDLLAGLSFGLVNSDQTTNLTSSQWWGAGLDTTQSQYTPTKAADGTYSWTVVDNTTTPIAQGLYFRNAQSNSQYYNIYADALAGPNPLKPLTLGYGFPLQDRLNNNLIKVDPNTDTQAYIRFIINSDSGTAIESASWDSGANTGNWGDGANWNPNGVPSPTAEVQFGTGSQTTIDTQTDRTVAALYFNYGAPAFVFNNNTITVNGDIVNSSTNLQTINSALAFGTDSTLTTVTGDLAFDGINLSTHTVTFASLGHADLTTTVSGVIQGSGGIIKSGLGTLILTGINTFTGPLKLIGGTLELGSASAAGSGTLQIAGGILEATAPLTLTPAVTLKGGVEIGGTNPFTLAGTLTLTGSAFIKTDADLTLQGVLGATGSGSSNYILTKTGTGSLTLNGSVANPFAGLIEVNDGTLNLNNTTGPAFAGNLTIGDGTGAASSAQAVVQSAGQTPIGNTTTVTVASDGKFDLGANDVSLLALTMTGGSVTGTTGQLLFNGQSASLLTFSGANSSTATISSGIELTAGTTSLNINPNQATTQLTVSGALSGVGGLSKNLEGTAIFSSASNLNYTGLVTVAGGILGMNDLSAATLVTVGGAFSPGEVGQIASITVKTLTLQGGGFVFDLGATNTSDQIAVSTTLNDNAATQFIFNNAGIVAGAEWTFTLMTGVTGLNLSNLSYVSQNISGLTGTFQLNGGNLEFKATAGTTFTWTGTDSGQWNIGNNWNPAGPPIAGADLEFATSANLTVDTQTNQTVGNLTFNSGADAFTIQNNTLTLGGDVTNLSTNLQTINSNLTLNYNRTLAATNGDVTLGGLIALSQNSLANTLTFDVAASQTITVNGAIQNLTSSLANSDPNGNVVKTGDGTLVLNGSNTFSGSLTFEDGIVAITSINALGANTAVKNAQLLFDGGTLQVNGNVSYSNIRQPITLLAGGATFDVGTGFTFSINTPLIGVGGLTLTGTGTLALTTSTALSTYQGPLTVNGGTLTVALAGALGDTSNIVVGSGGTIAFSSNLAINQTPISLAGTGVAGVGALAFSGGAFTINTPITLTDDASIVASNSATLVLDGTVLNQGNTLTIDTDGPAGITMITFGSSISGAGGFTKTGAATLSLLGGSTNTYTGVTTIDEGILSLTADANLTGATGAITVDSGAALQFNFAPTSVSDPAILLTHAIAITGAGVANQASGAIYNLLGNTTLKGAITLGGDATIGASTGLLTLAGTVALGSDTLTFNLEAGSQANVSGIISGTGGLELSGGGNLTLSGANTFSGDVSLQGGTLIAAGKDTLGSGTVTIEPVGSGVIPSTLSLQGGIKTGTAALVLNGTGVGGIGALTNLTGDNTYDGDISVSSATLISATAGQLTLGGATFSNGAQPVTFNTSASTAAIVVKSAITGTGAYLIQGSGTVSFASANPSLTGPVTVSGGTLATGNLNALQNVNLNVSNGGAFSPGGEGVIMTANLQTLTPATGSKFIFDLTSPGNSDSINLSVGGINFGSKVLTFQLEEVGTFAGAGTYTLMSGTGAFVGFGSINLAPSASLSSYQFSLAASGTDLNLVVTGSGPVSAQWLGGGTDGNWTTPANWNGNVVPAAGSPITFAGSDQTTVATVANQATGSITFDNTAAAFIINGNTLTVAGGILNDSTNLQTINSALVFNTSRTIDAASGDLALGAIAINSLTATARTLTFTGAENISVSGIISNGAMANGNLAKTGTGTLTLTGVNTYAGTTTLGAGILSANSSSALGSGIASNTLIFNGGTLQAAGTINSPATRSISFLGAGSIDTNGNPVTLAGALAGSGDLTKLGANSLILTGSNSGYTGDVAINDGTVNIQSNSALGSGVGGTTVASGAALELQNNITVTAEPLTLNGTGVSGNGALRNVSGANTFGGPITLGSAATIRAESGSTLNLSGVIDLGSDTLTFAGPGTQASSGGISGTGDVVMDGTGSVTLTGTNSYSGTTTLSQGTLASGDLANSAVILNGGTYSPGGVNSIANVTFDSLTLTSGDLLFDLGASTSDHIDITTAAALGGSIVFEFNGDGYVSETPVIFTLLTAPDLSGFALSDLSYHSQNIANLTGSFSVSGNDLLFTTTAPSGTIWNGGGGTGDWGTGANWTAGVPTPGEAVQFGGTTELNVDTQTNRSTGTITFNGSAGAFTISNNTISLTGGIINQSTAVQTFASDLQLNSNATFNAANGDLKFDGDIALSSTTAARTLTFTGANDIEVNGIISNGSAATGNLAKTGTGTLELKGVNTYSGTTTLTAGTTAVSNDNSLGDGSATNTLIFNGGTLRADANFTSAATRGITLQSSGILDTNGNDVTLAGIITGAGGLTKQGLGTLELSGDNQFQGAIALMAGTLIASNDSALGNSATGTAVNGGATLELQNVNLGNETLVLNGAGDNGAGALYSSTGANVVSGNIGLGSASEIQADSSLTLGGSIVFGTFQLSLTNTAAVLISGGTSGSGTFLKDGAGTLTLTGMNLSTGKLTISDGTVSIGNGGTTGSVLSAIQNDSALVFNRSNAQTYNGTISGSGTLEQMGTSILSLGGTNAYSGATTITSGAIQATSNTALGTAAAGTTVASGASLQLSNNVNIGAETLGLQGTGLGGNGALQNVSGTNTYGGVITLAGDTTIQSTVGQLNLTGAIANVGHAVTFNTTGGNVTVSSAMTGAGNVVKTGAGTLTAANVNAFGTGTVKLNAGTIAVVGTVNATSFDWSSGQIALDLSGSNILNANDFNHVGSSPVTFSFSNATDGVFTLVTFTNQTGFTSADFAAAFVGNNYFDVEFSLLTDRLLLTLTPNVQEGPYLNNGEGVPTNANFIVNGFVTTSGPVYSNVVNSLTFMGGSQLFFANNTVSVTSGNVTLAPGATSVVNGEGTFLFPNGFNLLGSGALNVEIPVEVTGQTNVNANTRLYVNNTWTTQQLNVLAGGELYGSGTINGALVNSGTVNPGNSPGTLTVNGNFTQTNTGTLVLEIASPGVFDQLIVNGAASLAGNLQVSLLGGFVPVYGEKFQFLTAFSMEGSFSAIDGLPDGFRGRVLQENGDATLLIAPSDYRIPAQNPNQRNVAGALNSYIPATGGDRETVSIALDELSAAEYPAAFNAIAPGYYETLTDIIIQQNNSLAQNLTQQISSARTGKPGFRTSGIELLPIESSSKDGKGAAKDEILIPSKDNRWGIWTMATGIFATTTSVNNIPNYRFDTGGFLVGVDFRWNEAFVTGLYAGYQYTEANYGGSGGDTRINTFNFGGYATWQPTPGRGFYVDGIAGAGFSDYRVQRPIQFGSVDRAAVSKPQGGNLTTQLNLGYDWQVGGFTFGPIGSLQYTYAAVGGFTETGADSLDLRVNQYGENSLTSSLGGRVAYTWIVAPKIAIIPEARLLWQHEFMQNPTAINSALDGGSGSGFDWTTAAPARDSAFAGVGVTLQLGDRLNLNVYYNADFGANDYIGQSISTSARVEF